MSDIKVGDYVTDTSDSSRFYKSIYRVTGFSWDRAIVRRIGQIVNGKLACEGDQGVTHRTTANLQPWK